MPKWLQHMVAPTVMLWLCALAVGIAWGIDAEGMPKQASGVASNIGVPLVVASWVMADARKRGRRLCYDYGSFAYFAWPAVVPIYLFQTRGARAFLTLLSFAAIWLMAALAAGVLRTLRYSLLP